MPPLGCRPRPSRCSAIGRELAAAAARPPIRDQDFAELFAEKTDEPPMHVFGTIARQWRRPETAANSKRRPACFPPRKSALPSVKADSLGLRSPRYAAGR
jgi:hypothetical protein